MPQPFSQAKDAGMQESQNNDSLDTRSQYWCKYVNEIPWPIAEHNKRSAAVLT
jgi:hypothetical protein